MTKNEGRRTKDEGRSDYDYDDDDDDDDDDDLGGYADRRIDGYLTDYKNDN